MLFEHLRFFGVQNIVVSKHQHQLEPGPQGYQIQLCEDQWAMMGEEMMGEAARKNRYG